LPAALGEAASGEAALDAAALGAAALGCAAGLPLEHAAAMTPTAISRPAILFDMGPSLSSGVGCVALTLDTRGDRAVIRVIDSTFTSDDQ
jgi:hypothetical protein